MSVVVISTVTFVLGTMPELTDNLDIMLFDNETEVDSDKACLKVRNHGEGPY